MDLWTIIITFFLLTTYLRGNNPMMYWILMGWCLVLSSPYLNPESLVLELLISVLYIIFFFPVVCSVCLGTPVSHRTEGVYAGIPGNWVTFSDPILKDNLPVLLCEFMLVHPCTYLPLWLWCTHSFLLLSQRRTGTLNPLESISLIFYIPAFH